MDNKSYYVEKAVALYDSIKKKSSKLPPYVPTAQEEKRYRQTVEFNFFFRKRILDCVDIPESVFYNWDEFWDFMPVGMALHYLPSLILCELSYFIRNDDKVAEPYGFPLICGVIAFEILSKEFADFILNSHAKTINRVMIAELLNYHRLAVERLAVGHFSDYSHYIVSPSVDEGVKTIVKKLKIKRFSDSFRYQGYTP